MSGIPTLETTRLRLRPPVIADFLDYAAFLASDRAVHMGGPYDERAAWGLFGHDIACWHLFGHGALMIERKADCVCIGQVGINAGPLFPERELGWLLYAGYEGRGYATEAAATLRDWAFGTLGLETLVSYVDQANSASAAVARRLGGAEDLAAVRGDPVDIVYRYARPAGSRQQPLDIEQAFAPLIGLPAWQVRRGHANYLTLEFGEPHLRTREAFPDARVPIMRRRQVSTMGDYHFWVHCCHWTIFEHGVAIAHEEAEDNKIDGATKRLDSQTLMSLAGPDGAGTLRFVFEHNLILELRPYASYADFGEEGAELWMLFRPDGQVVSSMSDGSLTIESAKRSE